MSAVETYLNQLITLFPNGKQGDFYKWLLANGRVYDRKATEIGKYSHFVSVSEISACFKNSLCASMVAVELKYVEGYYVTDTIGFPFEHGFNVNSDGEVIDFTTAKSGANVIEYFGVEIPAKYFNRFLKSKYNGMVSLMTWYYMTIILKEK